MKETYSGSCLCSQVKYEIEGQFEKFYLCHCEYCQKDSGSAHTANLFSSKAKLKWIEGKDNVQTYTLPSTRHTKSFCKECGAAVPSLQMEGKLLVVPAGGLNTDVAIRPDAHVFFLSKASWDDGLESIKKFEKFPS